MSESLENSRKKRSLTADSESVRRQESPRERELQFKTPYHEVTLAEFSREVPEKKTELEHVLTEIDKQGIENFGVFQSKMFPGVLRGAMVVEKTSKNLPEELQNVTQRLLDNPSGEHEPHRISSWLHGAQVAAGLAGETVSRMLFDDTMKSLIQKGNKLVDNLSEETGIPKDDKEQMQLKRKAAVVEGLALLKGASAESESVRSFIRRGIYDPQTFTPSRLVDIWKKQREGIKTPFFQKGKSVEVPFRGNHFFFYNRYKRWAQILDFVKGTQGT